MRSLSLSQTTGYAIQALSCLTDDPSQLVFAKDIAKQTKIPKAYLAKILLSLSLSGMIVSKRGYRGGVALTRPANQISLLDIVKAVDGKLETSQCLLGLAECSDERACPVHEFWKVERQRIIDQLRCTTLADLAEFEKCWQYSISDENQD